MNYIGRCMQVFKLIKYEWMNRWKFFLGGAIVCILLNINLMRKMMIQDTESSFFIGILFAVIFVLGIVLAVDHIRRIYNYLFTEQGYFLFTIPLNGYKILGSKMITIFLECLGIVLLTGIMMFIDYKILINRFPEMMVPTGFPQDTLFFLMKIGMLIFMGYIIFLLMIYLSMVLVKSILYAVKYGKILSFVFFIIISEIFRRITSWFMYTINNYGDLHHYMLVNVNFNTIPNAYILLNLCTIGILFVLTGYLLDRKINL